MRIVIFTLKIQVLLFIIYVNIDKRCIQMKGLTLKKDWVLAHNGSKSKVYSRSMDAFGGW